ncbi:flagellar biosynthetic protein FlhB [Rhodoferax koreense]|uniref:Flagellar biosynthetic protein FlhB n=1 Tax=Rhodoferax koreensis TaxID=1842727 RepID=A0A1P8JSA6_9BURK|nr:EscU/YscU/HrcU family type III secretion system export apparatus switch protein [Rhodoferax koreense]APW36629.1 flagellar biosynthetic protein FlhB [Rhodoferax koreense]
MDSSSQDKNLPATERKLQQARKDGQASRSRDLSHLAVLGTGMFTLLVLGPTLFERLKLALSQQLSFNLSTLATNGSMLDRLQDMVAIGLVAASVFAAIVLAAAIGSAVAAGGWIASLKPIMPDPSRLNPFSGVGRLFSKQQVTEVAKLIVITTVLIAVAWSFMAGSLQSVASLVMQPSTAALRHLVSWITSGMSLLLLVVFAVAMIDVPLQAFLMKSRLKMSHQEVKQEHKESDGNPQMKGKMRARAREIAQRSSVANVPKADFVLMNPTHFAVAIRYDEKTMAAPQVISKGADLLAMKIREIAGHHKVPVFESPRLARALYAHAELDKEIPSSLYTAVAQVLAYVYRLKAAMRGEGPMPDVFPQPFVPPELDPLSKTVLAEDAP